MSIEDAYRRVRATGCVYGSPEQLKAQLADIAAYLGTKDPMELGAALLLEQAGYKRSQLQLGVVDGTAMRHVVEVTTEGFQVLDTRTDALHADVWASRREAEAACDELNRVALAPAPTT